MRCAALFVGIIVAQIFPFDKPGHLLTILRSESPIAGPGGRAESTEWWRSVAMVTVECLAGEYDGPRTTYEWRDESSRIEIVEREIRE